MQKTDSQGDAPLDLLYADLVRAAGSADGSSILDICLKGGQKEIASIPLRFRLIALGFVKKLSPEEVNRRLLENGCPRLYARSYWEASVIFALRKGLSYPRWKELLAQNEDQREKIASKSRALSGSTITLSDLRRYVDDNSLREADLFATLQVTKALEKELAASAAENEEGQDSDREAFRGFLLDNIDSFRTVREKARYYFCKYLLYDLDGRKKACVKYVEAEALAGYRDAGTIPSDSVLLQDLQIFKVRSLLKRKKHTREEIIETLENAALSLRTIYDLYSSFYFDYPFRDWKQILAESGTDPLTLSPDAAKTLAEAVRRDADRRKTDQAPEDPSDTGQLQWLQKKLGDLEKEECQDKKTSYQSGREGENFLRKILRGTLDPDRTTLLSFLLYFGTAAIHEIPVPHRIDRKRLDVILEESGFPVLDPSLPFDHFVCSFLESPDPWSFLIEQAEEMALSGKNFYLHRAWLLAESGEARWQKLI